MNRLRSELELGTISHVIFHDPDRMARNLVDQLLIADQIEKAKANLFFVTGDYDASPEGKLFFSMRGAISVFEKAKIRERTMRGKLKKAQSGKVIRNSKPYGFNWDAKNSTYTINTAESEVVKLIYDLCINERRGVGTITQELRQREIKYRYDKSWPTDTVYRILKSELYCGTFYQYKQRTKKTGQRERETTLLPKEEWIGVPVQPIIDRNTWEKAQQVIKENYKFAKRNTKNKYLLSGLVKCGVCGMGMAASNKKNKGKNYAYYSCIKNKSAWYIDQKCSSGYFSVSQIDDIVWDQLTKIATKESGIEEYFINYQTPNYDSKITLYNAKLQELELLQRDTFKWYKEKIIKSEIAEKELRDISNEISSITNTLNEITVAQSKISIPNKMSSIDILNAQTFEDKRKVLIDLGWKYYAERKDGQLQMRIGL